MPWRAAEQMFEAWLPADVLRGANAEASVRAGTPGEAAAALEETCRFLRLKGARSKRNANARLCWNAPLRLSRRPHGPSHATHCLRSCRPRSPCPTGSGLG